jgi:asparagine synthase (glutamine-hydrolysing)
MSGIAAVFNLDGRPVEHPQLERLVDAMAHRGRDGLGRYFDGPAALGHAMLRVTPESVAETQPLRDDPSGICLTFNGRVDNRGELRALIEAAGETLRNDTDAEMVLRAYRCFGVECAAKIIGDFAFVVWDPGRRRMYCARDHAGMIPFYYHCDGKTFLAASELQQILRDPAVKQEPNEGIIGEYLCGKLFTCDETLFRGVMRLPPSHQMVVTESGPRISRHYDLNPARSIRYRTDDQYAAHFLEVFKEAVRCRLRSRTGIAAELSGGLDSSSIVSVVQSMRQRGEIEVPEFETFSLTYDEPSADERKYVASVVGKWGLKSNLVTPREMDLKSCMEYVARFREWAESPSGAVYYSLRERVVEKGFQVILTGMGGDQWLTGSDYYYAELLSEFRFAALARVLKSDWRFGIPGTRGHSRLKNLGWWGLRPLLPEWLRIALSDMVPRERFPPFIPAAFARRIDLVGRLRAAPLPPAGASFSQRSIYDEFNSGWMVSVMELIDRDNGPIGIEQRHPFYDIRLVEFCLAIPEEQRLHNNQIKYVMRNAMKGLLPEDIRTRMTKGQFSAMTVRLFDRIGGAHFFDRLAIAERGWVDEAIAARLARERLTSYAGANLWPLVNAFAIEVWYNVIFRNGGDLLARLAKRPASNE